jgi:hypothetical protein
MPANTAEPEGLYQVTCLSSSACLVLGSYQDSTGNLLGWLVTGGGASWTATQAPVPADAATNPNLSLNSATCQAQCVMTGTYNDSSNTEQGILITGSGSTWTATKAPMPTGAMPGNDFLGSVTCDPQLACLVTGYYTDSSHNTQGWLISGTG